MTPPKKAVSEEIPGRLKLLDIPVLLILAAAAAAFFPMHRAASPDVVEILRGETLIARYPLSQPRVFTVTGQKGPVTIQIAEGAARVVEADCPHGFCKAAGATNTPYHELVCAPNHLVVRVRSSTGNDREIDATAR
jgi:hypothetical protein